MRFDDLFGVMVVMALAICAAVGVVAAISVLKWIL
jgi:hypothetical protein